jgi:ribosomal protein S27AE
LEPAEAEMAASQGSEVQAAGQIDASSPQGDARINSSLPYDRSLLGRTPSPASTQTVLARDPLCVFCGAESVVADHEPSLLQRWVNGEYHNMTLDQIRADADNPDRMIGACMSCNSSKGGLPLEGEVDGWNYENSPAIMRLLEWF